MHRGAHKGQQSGGGGGGGVGCTGLLQPERYARVEIAGWGDVRGGLIWVGGGGIDQAKNCIKNKKTDMTNIIATNFV